MVDIHTHIIPNIDDGAQSVEDSFEIFKEAYSEGFSEIFLTPHYIKGYYETDTYVREVWVKSIQDTLDKLQIPIKVYIGNEIYISEDMDELILKNQVSSLNDSRYVLFELPMNSQIKYLDEIIFKIFNIDKIPIIAHPERYSYVKKDIFIVRKLKEKGVLFQSNYGSILDMYGKDSRKTLEKLLKENLIDFLGSDVHRPNSIYNNIKQSKEKLKKILGEKRLEDLTTINPKKIILNEEIYKLKV